MIRCPKCKSHSQDQNQCTQCGIHFSGYQRFLSRFDSKQNLKDEGQFKYGGRVAPETVKSRILTLPIYFLVSSLILSVPFFYRAVFNLLSLPLHELGHAFAYWLGGTLAFPVGVFVPLGGVTFPIGGRNPALFLIFVGLWIYLGYRAFQVRRYYLSFVSVVVCLFSFQMFWVYSPEKFKFYAVLGGFAGEVIISTFFIISYHYRFPDFLRWDFFRYFFLGLGSIVFSATLKMWMKIEETGQLPRGTYFGGSSDRNGDIDRILLYTKWTDQELVTYFLGITQFCLVLIVLHYVYFIWFTYRNPVSLEHSE